MTALRMVFAVLGACRRTALLLAVVALLALNVATLTVASVEAFVGGALAAATGLNTVAGRLRGEVRSTTVDLDRERTHRQRLGKKLRTSRAGISRRLSRAVASTPAKTIPVAGAALVLTMTAAELASACEEFAEIDGYLAEEETPEDGDDAEMAFRTFCKQNERPLRLINERAQPLLEPFDQAGAQVWGLAADLITRAEKVL